MHNVQHPEKLYGMWNQYQTIKDQQVLLILELPVKYIEIKIMKIKLPPQNIIYLGINFLKTELKMCKTLTLKNF